VAPRDERGSRASRRLRREGFVPGVVYGIGSDAVPFKVDGRRLRAVLAEGHALFDVEVDGGKPEPVIVKDEQRDPVRGTVQHLDLLKVRLDEKIQATVALELVGVEDAPGVREGGVLEHVTREVTIEALPTDIPDGITADVSGMGIAETMTLDTISAPAGVEIIGELEEIVVATITAPSEVEVEEEIEEEAELVGEEGEVPEGEEAAEAGEEGGEPAAEAGGEEG
jgi:large subunit ribosomal protein L25